MARTTSRLTAMKVSQTKKAGMYADGGGLYLRVAKEGSKHWVYRFMLNGRPRWMGLGPLALSGLQEARGKALDARRLRYEGVDPIDARQAARAQARTEAAQAITFKQCAEAFIKTHRAGWRNAKHAAQCNGEPPKLESNRLPSDRAVKAVQGTITDLGTSVSLLIFIQ